MTIQSIFVNQKRLRPIWRFLISAVAIVVSVIALQIGLGILFGIAGIHPDIFLGVFLTGFNQGDSISPTTAALLAERAFAVQLEEVGDPLREYAPDVSERSVEP